MAASEKWRSWTNETGEKNETNCNYHSHSEKNGGHEDTTRKIFARHKGNLACGFFLLILIAITVIAIIVVINNTLIIPPFI